MLTLSKADRAHLEGLGDDAFFAVAYLTHVIAGGRPESDPDRPASPAALGASDKLVIATTLHSLADACRDRGLEVCQERLMEVRRVCIRLMTRTPDHPACDTFEALVIKIVSVLSFVAMKIAEWQDRQATKFGPHTELVRDDPGPELADASSQRTTREGWDDGHPSTISSIFAADRTWTHVHVHAADSNIYEGDFVRIPDTVPLAPICFNSDGIALYVTRVFRQDGTQQTYEIGGEQGFLLEYFPWKSIQRLTIGWR